MSEYYAVQRSDEYLAHYGVKGMKWGVRKAMATGGSAGVKALSKQYNKASKKLAKLEKRAASGKKYAKRAAKLGLAAGAAGGLAVAGTKGVSKALHKVGGVYLPASFSTGSALKKYKGPGKEYVNAAGDAIRKTGAPVSEALGKASKAVNAWGGKTAISYGNKVSKSVKGATSRAGDTMNLVGKGHTLSGRTNNITNNRLARAGAAVAGAGLLGAAGYNAYRAATTKRAAKKAAQFRSEMQKAFKGTQYESKMPAQYQPKKRRKSRNA